MNIEREEEDNNAVVEEEEEMKVEKSNNVCSHTEVQNGVCQNCDYKVPQFGFVLDTGSVSTFIKVVYVDESKKSEVKASKE